MKFYFVLPLLCLALAVKGQQENEIRFESLPNWQSVLEKAKTENKMIFVDCFATWCGPCKAMEQTTFKDVNISNFTNSHFISIRLQMDSSKKDDDNVRTWYSSADDFKKSYQIAAFPTFLFFSSDGTAVHKDIGYKNDSEYLALCRNALNPDSQYYERIKQVRQGHFTVESIKSLLDYTTKIGDKGNAKDVGGVCIQKYFDTLDERQVFTKENIDFLVTYRSSISSKDRIFRIIYEKPYKIDSIFGGRVAVPLTDDIVNAEEVKPATDKAKSTGLAPDWPKIYDDIKTKYTSAMAERLIVQAKVKWFKYKKEWHLYSTFLTKKMDFFLSTNPTPGFSTMITLNNAAWEIFLHSEKKDELLEAVKWTDLAMPMERPQTQVVIDTKANLLYKAGKKQEAIALEKRALEISKNDPGIAATLAKMKAGKSTWDVKD